jgi:hypothetical protein
MELTPEVTRRFVEDMEAYSSEPKAIKRDEIAAREGDDFSPEVSAGPLTFRNERYNHKHQRSTSTRVSAMPYDFTRFSPQSFERFAQALVAKQLGPGISIFGAGPDGAREASFHGPLPITTHGAAWDGYVVAQSKYRSATQGGVGDAAWLRKELTADFEKFLDPKRNLKQPEYYIAISNVVLSSVDSGSRKGGQRSIEDLFESYKAKLGLRGWLVWHADLLSSMLDASQEIRTRYTAWVTEGDVLASALTLLQKPSFASTVPLALRRDLRKDRDIRRKDAGQITDKRIYLEDVFVDLPLESRGSAHHSTSGDADEDDTYAPGSTQEAIDAGSEIAEPHGSAPSPGVLARLMERSADKLDPPNLKRRTRNERKRPALNRIVLLGGPGQGKSTVAQFLAQVSRARVSIASLRNEPPDLALEAAEAILLRAQQEGISLPGPARFPMHVELPKFADAIKLASDQGAKLSLLRHCSDLLGRESDQKIDPTDLRTWLGQYPWLLILDGLDEVPATGNRSDVVLAVNEFLDDVNHVDGDVLVVITTRPQGYGDDFSRRYWEHWSMGTLAPEDAMRFATRLADVLLSDGSRRDEILSELKRASDDPATAPIMISGASAPDRRRWQRRPVDAPAPASCPTGDSPAQLPAQICDRRALFHRSMLDCRPKRPAPKNSFCKPPQTDHPCPALLRKIFLFLFFRNRGLLTPSRLT